MKQVDTSCVKPILGGDVSKKHRRLPRTEITDKSSSARACAMGSSEREEYMECSPRYPAATAYTIRAAVICGVEKGFDPLTGA